jgi:hypothetical protein
VLDFGLPRMDGPSVMRRWRAEGAGFPILVLSARGAWTALGGGDRCRRQRPPRQALHDGGAARTPSGRAFNTLRAGDIAAACGGEIRLGESQLGGLRVTVTWPRDAAR